MTQPDPMRAMPTRRIKATDGMAVTADVWEEAHNYHRQHQELHALLSHGPGVVSGLNVVANDPPDSAVYILPGLAVDPTGRTIVLAEPLTYELGTGEGRLYLLIAYGESPARSENGQVQEGAPTYMQSQFSLAAGSTLPNTPHVEIARLMRVGRNAPISDAKNSASPAANEIDLRFRRGSATLAPAPVGVAVVHAGGGSGPEHGRGAAALARGLRAGGRFQLWVDDNVRLDSSLDAYGLVYLVGHGSFQLSANEMNALFTFIQAGGTLLAESCRRDAAMAAASDGSFLALFASLGIRLQNLPAGHSLLQEPAFFNVLPPGYETAGAPQVQVAEGVIFSGFDYGCLWQGERRSGLASREEIRAAHELGENLVHLAASEPRRARQPSKK